MCVETHYAFPKAPKLDDTMGRSDDDWLSFFQGKREQMVDQHLGQPTAYHTFSHFTEVFVAAEPSKVKPDTGRHTIAAPKAMCKTSNKAGTKQTFFETKLSKVRRQLLQQATDGNASLANNVAKSWKQCAPKIDLYNAGLDPTEYQIWTPQPTEQLERNIGMIDFHIRKEMAETSRQPLERHNRSMEDNDHAVGGMG